MRWLPPRSPAPRTRKERAAGRGRRTRPAPRPHAPRPSVPPRTGASPTIRCDPSTNCVPPLARNAEQLDVRSNRDRRGELGGPISPPASRPFRRSARAPAPRSTGRLQDPARDEGTIDKVSGPCGLGRLKLKDRSALQRVERLEDETSAPAGPIPSGSSRSGILLADAETAVAQGAQRHRRGGSKHQKS